MIGFGSLRFLPSVRRLIHTEHCKQRFLPNSWDLMTGKERWQAIQWAKGNQNPFLNLPMRRGPGTKECPNVVLSIFDKRIVGCVCDSNSKNVVWWWIHEGYPRRCRCNYWFVLERIETPTLYDS